jgi:hypothetical protein
MASDKFFWAWSCILTVFIVAYLCWKVWNAEVKCPCPRHKSKEGQKP